jgi:hypothetical protein
MVGAILISKNDAYHLLLANTNSVTASKNAIDNNLLIIVQWFLMAQKYSHKNH